MALTKSGGDTTLDGSYQSPPVASVFPVNRGGKKSSIKGNGLMIAFAKELGCDDYLFDMSLYNYEEESVDDGPKLSCVEMQQLLAQFRQGVGEVVESGTIASNIINRVVIPMAVNNFLGTVDHYDDVYSAIESLKYELRAAKKWGNNQSCEQPYMNS